MHALPGSSADVDVCSNVTVTLKNKTIREHEVGMCINITRRHF